MQTGTRIPSTPSVPCAPSPVAGSPAGRSEATGCEAQRIPTYFHVGCGVCGRQLRVLIEHLGRRIACGHCGQRFVAADPATDGDRRGSLLERADQLLERSALARSK